MHHGAEDKPDLVRRKSMNGHLRAHNVIVRLTSPLVASEGFRGLCTQMNPALNEGELNVVHENVNLDI